MMADEHAPLKKVIQMLETTPDSPVPSAVPIPTVFNNDISNQRERLAVLVLSHA